MCTLLIDRRMNYIGIIFEYNSGTEYVGMTVTFQTFIRAVLDSNLGQDTVYSD